MKEYDAIVFKDYIKTLDDLERKKDEEVRFLLDDFTARGLELFSKLMNPLDKEVHKKELYFLEKFQRRVIA